MAPGKLSCRQREIVEQITGLILSEASAAVAGSGRRRCRAAAVVGRRGIGKTTVLEHLKEQLAGQQTTGGSTVVVTQAIDAAVVGRDLGLAGAAIRRLYRVVDPVVCYLREDAGSAAGSTGTGQPQVRSRQPLLHGAKAEQLQQRFSDAFRSALMQQESYRVLALELAMSPDHYTDMVSQTVLRKERSREELEQYVDALAAVYQEEAQQLCPNEVKKPRFVVLIDDLDLADRSLIEPWFRSMLTVYDHPSLFWILAFDRERLIELLSPPAGTVATGAGDPQARDLICGRALLSKVVPTSRQLELYSWDFPRRAGFVPLPAGRSTEQPEPQTLGNLLGKLDLAALQPLIPADPRALAEVYRFAEHWLDRDRNGSGKHKSHKDPGEQSTGGNERDSDVDDGEQETKSTGAALTTLDSEAVRFLSLVRGEHRLVRLLDTRGATRLATLFILPKEPMTEGRWATMVAGLGGLEPIWELPVPDLLKEQVEAEAAEAYLEVLLDLATRQRVLSPYQVLQRLPFLQSRLEQASCERAFTEQEVKRHFEEQRPGELRASLVWQQWSDKATKEQEWLVRIGPDLLWQAIAGLRDAAPTSLWRELYLEPVSLQPVLEQAIDDSGGTISVSDLLPCRLRALLLLVDGLIRVPWRRLAAAWNLWDPLDFARCAVLFTLAAYHHGLGLTRACPALAGLDTGDSETVASLVAATPEELRERLAAAFDEVEEAAGTYEPDGGEAPIRLARQELNRSLQCFLRLMAVQGLKEK